MRVRVEGSGLLKRYLPPEGFRIVTTDEPRPLSELLKQMSIPLEAVLAAGIGDNIVDLEHFLHDGETIRLIPLMGGG